MKRRGRALWSISIVLAVVGGDARASVTITGFASSKYLITSTPVTSDGDGVLKMTFENRTPETNVSLCMGTMDDFAQDKCAMHLSGAGGPGSRFLTIIDAKELSGKVFYALRTGGTAACSVCIDGRIDKLDALAIIIASVLASGVK